MLEIALTFASPLLSGLTAGIFLGTQLGQIRVQQRLDARELAALKQRFELAVGGIMPPLLIVTALSPTPVVVLLWSTPGPALSLAATAVVVWIATIVVTLIFNVPVNRLAKSWDPDDPPANWIELRRRWHLGQAIRAVLGVAAFAALSLAALIDR